MSDGDADAATADLCVTAADEIDRALHFYRIAPLYSGMAREPDVLLELVGLGADGDTLVSH